jgi:hypothetical protein
MRIRATDYTPRWIVPKALCQLGLVSANSYGTTCIALEGVASRIVNPGHSQLAHHGAGAPIW